MSDLVLFFSCAEKLPAAITSHDVEKYMNHRITNGRSPIIINYIYDPLRAASPWGTTA